MTPRVKRTCTLRSCTTRTTLMLLRQPLDGDYYLIQEEQKAMAITLGWASNPNPLDWKPLNEPSHFNTLLNEGVRVRVIPQNGNVCILFFFESLWCPYIRKFIFSPGQIQCRSWTHLFIFYRDISPSVNPPSVAIHSEVCHEISRLITISDKIQSWRRESN